MGAKFAVSVSAPGDVTAGVLYPYRWPSFDQLTYGFPPNVNCYGTGIWSTGNNPFSALNSNHKAVGRLIYAEYQRICGAVFTEGTETAGVVSPNDLLSAYGTTGDSGDTNSPGGSSLGTGGNTVFDPSQTSFSYVNPLLGSWDWWSTAHEFGHQVGLKHPHEDDGTGFHALDSLGFGTLNAHYNTIMGYKSIPGGGDPGFPSCETYGFPWFGSWIDHLALQKHYGAGPGYSGDTVYTFDKNTGVLVVTDTVVGTVTYPTPGANRIFWTLVGGSTGTKTIDVSAYTTDQTFDFRQPSGANPTYGNCVFNTAQLANLDNGSTFAPYNVKVPGTSGWIVDRVKPGTGNNTITFNPAGAANTLVLPGAFAAYSATGSVRSYTITTTATSKTNTCTSLDYVLFSDGLKAVSQLTNSNQTIVGGLVTNTSVAYGAAISGGLRTISMRWSN
ncbi:MAG: hypothetical protein ACXWIU_12325 [Limisphaerales bacterium]